MQEAGKSASLDVLCNTEKDIFGLEILVCSTTQIDCSSLWNIVQLLLTTQLKSGDWRKKNDLASELVVYALMRSFNHASHQCGRDSLSPIAVYTEHWNDFVYIT